MCCLLRLLVVGAVRVCWLLLPVVVVVGSVIAIRGWHCHALLVLVVAGCGSCLLLFVVLATVGCWLLSLLCIAVRYSSLFAVCCVLIVLLSLVVANVVCCCCCLLWLWLDAVVANCGN